MLLSHQTRPLPAAPPLVLPLKAPTSRSLHPPPVKIKESPNVGGLLLRRHARFAAWGQPPRLSIDRSSITPALLPLRQFFLRIHASAALLRAAPARGGIIRITIVEVVVVRKFL